MKPLADCRLYTFVDTAYLRGRDPAEIARRLCDGGSDLIQLRAKSSAPDEIRRMAEALLPITQAAGVGLVINDHPAIALQVGAPFCHLGQEDFFDAGHQHADEVRNVEVRNVECGMRNEPVPVPASHSSLNTQHSTLRLGLSTHSPGQALRALRAEPDYLAVGPVFATPTKPTARPVTLDYVRWAAAHVPIPWFAIGGINLQNLDDVLAAGARRVCVVSAILNAPDITKACQEIARRLPSAGSNS